MSKQAHLADGTVLDFPDETPDDVVDRAVKQHLQTQSVPESTQAPFTLKVGKTAVDLPQAPANEPDPMGKYALLTGVDLPTYGRRILGAVADVLNPTMPGGSTLDTTRTIPELGSQEEIGGKVSTLGTLSPFLAEGMTSARNLIKGLIPSKASAGAKFDVIREAAKDVPVDLSEAYDVIQRAKELNATGHGPLSEGMTKLETALQPARINVAGKETMIFPGQITYPTSFDFASAAKKASVAETTAQTDTLQGQVKQFARAIQTANRDAAAKVGMGDLFDQAMTEYRKAATLAEATDVIKTWAKKAALYSSLAGVAGGAGTAAYKLYETVFGK